MNREQMEELMNWLEETVDTISHGEISLKLRVREGHVHQVLREVIESQLITSLSEVEGRHAHFS